MSWALDELKISNYSGEDLGSIKVFLVKGAWVNYDNGRYWTS